MGAHRVIRVRDIDQLCADLCSLRDQGIGVLVVALERDLVQHTTVTRDVIVERWIRPVRGHNRVPFGDHQPHQHAQEPVDAFANRDVVHGRAVMRGNRSL